MSVIGKLFMTATYSYAHRLANLIAVSQHSTPLNYINNCQSQKSFKNLLLLYLLVHIYFYLVAATV